MEGHSPHTLEVFPKYFSYGNFIIHYTCNSPDERVLEKYKIVPLGEEFGCVNNLEVLKIPEGLYNKKGFENLKDKNILTCNLEKLLKNLK